MIGSARFGNGFIFFSAPFAGSVRSFALRTVSLGAGRCDEFAKRTRLVIIGSFPKESIVLTGSADQPLRILSDAIVIPIALGVVFPLSHGVSAAGRDGRKLVLSHFTV